MLRASGFKVKTGTIVDATIIGAPSSTKNADKAVDIRRTPRMPKVERTPKPRTETCTS